MIVLALKLGNAGQCNKIAITKFMVYLLDTQLRNISSVFRVWQGYIDDFSESRTDSTVQDPGTAGGFDNKNIGSCTWASETHMLRSRPSLIC